MDELFQTLDSVKSGRRTTYKKVIKDDTVAYDPLIPAVLGDGFLFQSGILDRVEKRLNNDGSETSQLKESAALSSLYESGEELEKEVISTKRENQRASEADIKCSQKALTNFVEKGATSKREELRQARQEPLKKNSLLSVEDPNATEMTQPILEYSSDLSKTQHVSSIQETTIAIEKTGKTLTQPQSSLDQVTLTICDHDTTPRDGLQATAADCDYPAELKIHEIQNELNREDGQKATYTATQSQKSIPKQNFVFSREAFVEDFDESSDTDAGESFQQEKATKVSPDFQKPDQSLRAASKSGPLNAYERRLKEQLHMDKGVVLSSESDGDEDDKALASLASKATVLEIKARLSKRKTHAEASRGRASLTALMAKLRKASKKQILDCQKEMVERHGLKMEDIEKEKEMVENLLDQEIARNKRIRLREREKQNKSQGTLSSEQTGQQDFRLTQTSRYEGDESDNYSYSGSNSEGSSYESEDKETVTHTQEMNVEDINSINNSDDENILRNTVRAHKAPVLSENESDEDQDSPIEDGIDLGSYGGNLSKNKIDEGYSSGSNETPPLSEELKTQHLNLMREQRKERAYKERQKMEEMKKSGVSNVFDVEAEESDDEWHGLGGVEGEVIDDYDSDLERMIDDFSHTTSNADQIRQLLIAENKETDLRTVNKILSDLKNGGFRKRRNNELQLELSDDDDDELRNYRKKRLDSMRRKRLQLGQSHRELLKSTKSSAFFDSMLEDLEDVKTPFDNQVAGPSEERQAEDEILEVSSKKTVALSREFVQETLSFLSSSRDNGEFEVSQAAEEGDSGDALLSLKQHSSVKSLHTPRKITVDEDHTHALPAGGRYVSVVKSFGNSTDPDSKIKDGKKTVTISNSYKTVGGSKTSITYLTKMRKLVAPKSKSSRPIKLRMVELSSIGKRRIFGSFDSSFET